MLRVADGDSEHCPARLSSSLCHSALNYLLFTFYSLLPGGGTTHTLLRTQLEFREKNVICYSAILVTLQLLLQNLLGGSQL